MHDPTCQGNDYFKCDFCRRGWSDDRPMVEGHQGSLVCAACLTIAYTEVWLLGGGAEHAAAQCAMCLETRDEAKWASPIHPESLVCKRCIKQSAVMLERDEDYHWKRPAQPS